MYVAEELWSFHNLIVCVCVFFFKNVLSDVI